jgi:hypothetical protein
LTAEGQKILLKQGLKTTSGPHLCGEFSSEHSPFHASKKLLRRPIPSEDKVGDRGGLRWPILAFFVLLGNNLN